MWWVLDMRSANATEHPATTHKRPHFKVRVETGSVLLGLFSGWVYIVLHGYSKSYSIHFMHTPCTRPFICGTCVQHLPKRCLWRESVFNKRPFYKTLSKSVEGAQLRAIPRRLGQVVSSTYPPSCFKAHVASLSHATRATRRHFTKGCSSCCGTGSGESPKRT